MLLQLLVAVGLQLLLLAAVVVAAAAPGRAVAAVELHPIISK